MTAPDPLLVNEFRRLEQRHQMLIVERTAAVALGPSLIRAFEAGTKPRVLSALLAINLGDLAACKTRPEFKALFENATLKVYEALAWSDINKNNHGQGLLWGHATKILCIYLRDLVLYSRYFDLETAERLEPLLLNPIDGVVLDKLRELGDDPGAFRIKDIDTAEKFWRLQRLLYEAASLANTCQIRFDDVQAEYHKQSGQ